MPSEHDDAKTATVFAVLRQLEGVDDKLMERLEVAHLPSMLEEGELPGCVVQSRASGYLFATDRRVLQVAKSLFNYSVKKVTSYSYDDIKAFRADTGLHPGLSMTTSRGVKTLYADKKGRQRFANFVRAQLGWSPQAVEQQKGVGKAPWIGAVGAFAIVAVVAVVGFVQCGPEPAPTPTPTPTPTLEETYLKSLQRWAYVLGLTLSERGLYEQAAADPLSVIEATTMDPAFEIRPLWMQNFDLMIRELDPLYLNPESTFAFKGLQVQHFHVRANSIKDQLRTMIREYELWKADPHGNIDALERLAAAHVSAYQAAEKLNLDVVKALNTEEH